MDKKPIQKPTLKTIIRKYLNEDCFFEKEKKKLDSKIHEFVFLIKYPKIKDKGGNGIGTNVSILKPKKKNCIEFATKILLHKEAFERFKKFDDNIKDRILWEIFTFLISQNLLPSIPENIEITFSDKLYFLDSEFPSINNVVLSKGIVRVYSERLPVFLDRLVEQAKIRK